MCQKGIQEPKKSFRWMKNLYPVNKSDASVNKSGSKQFTESIIIIHPGKQKLTWYLPHVNLLCSIIIRLHRLNAIGIQLRVLRVIDES